MPHPSPLDHFEHRTLSPEHAEILRTIDATDEQKLALVEVLEHLCRHALEDAIATESLF